MVNTTSKKYLNEKQTHYRQTDKSFNYSSLRIKNHKISKLGESFNSKGRNTASFSGSFEGNFSTRFPNLDISRELDPYTKRLKKNGMEVVEIDLPKGQFMKMTEIHEVKLNSYGWWRGTGKKSKIRIRLQRKPKFPQDPDKPGRLSKEIRLEQRNKQVKAFKDLRKTLNKRVKIGKMNKEKARKEIKGINRHLKKLAKRKSPLKF